MDRRRRRRGGPIHPTRHRRRRGVGRRPETAGGEQARPRDRRPPRRRGHRAARHPVPRHGGAGGLPLAQPGRRRAEPDRAGARPRARHHPHGGAA
ncbi:MAG: hypothetical protein DMD65_00030, partial [Gemmatimonadetes bacterium]